MNPENMQLLNLIEDIDDAVYESEYCVLNAMYEDYYKLTQICEYTEDFDSSVQLIMEGSFSKTVKKIGKNVSKVLRKIWKMIKAAWNAMKNFIGRILKRTKEGLHSAKKTTNQILHDMKKSGKKLVKKTKKVFHEAAEPVNNQQQTVKIVEIPADDKSEPEYKHQRVKSISSSMFVKINDSGKTVISIKNNRDTYYMKNSDNIDDERFTYHGGREWQSRHIQSALFSMRNKELLFKYLNAAVEACNVAFQVGQTATSYDDFIEKLEKANYAEISEKANTLEEEYQKNKTKQGLANEIPIEEFLEFQKELDQAIQKMEVVPKLCDILDKIGDVTETSEYFKNLIDVNQRIANKLFGLQMCMSYIATAYDNIWIPDEEFFDTIDDYETFDMFVNEMIQNHIPQKAVMKSAWLCAAPSIKGDGTQYKPIWGMMRGCFIPPNGEFIYKIALSQRSVLDNKTEIEINRQAQEKDKHDLQDVIARVIGHTENCAVNKMEKIYGIGSEAPLDYIKDKLRKSGIRYDITDLHRANVGFRNKTPKNGRYYSEDDQPVILDYAFVEYIKKENVDDDAINAWGQISGTDYSNSNNLI